MHAVARLALSLIVTLFTQGTSRQSDWWKLYVARPLAEETSLVFVDNVVLVRQQEGYTSAEAALGTVLATVFPKNVRLYPIS